MFTVALLTTIIISFLSNLFSCRLDVLAAVVEYVPDLSEKLCVRILAHLMLVAEADLVSAFSVCLVAFDHVEWSFLLFAPAAI